MRSLRNWVVIAVAGILIAGCSSAATTAPTTAPSGAPSEGPTAAAKKKITYVAPLIADANWQGVNTCVQSEADKLGFDVNIVAPINETASTAEMVSLTEQAIAAGAEGLIVVPLVAESWNDVLAKAKEKGIPVIAMGVDTAKPDQRNAFVGTDFDAFGAQAADVVAEATGGKGVIGILYSGPETTNQVQSIKVFRQKVAEKYPDMKIVGDDTIISPGGNRDLVKTTEVARSFLTANPEVNTIWSPDGQGGIAAANAAREMGKKAGEITIIGADYLPKVAADIAEGWQYGSIAFVACPWGEGPVQALDAHFKGTLEEGSTIYTPNIVYTKDNNPKASTLPSPAQ
jgi:galactofuranose transport system substrate-binding protein